MYSLTTEKSFDSAHFLKGYKGKCSNLHGHRWRVVVEVRGAELCGQGQTRGMLTDFSDLKHDLCQITDGLDHALIFEHGTLRDKTVAALREEDFKLIEVDFRPTAENFSKFFYDKMAARGYDVKCVSVYETPNNCASYTEDV